MTAGAVALTYGVARLGWTRPREAGLGLDGGSVARLGAGFGVGLGVLAIPAAAVAVVDGVRWVRVPGVGGEAAAALIAFLLLAGMEEVGFRGYPLLGTRRVLGLWTAQAVVAAAFVLYHVAGGQPWASAVVGTAAGSLLFGMAAVATDGLAVPVGVHAAWNFGEWALGGKPARLAGPGLWAVAAPVPAPSAAGTVAYLAAFGGATLAFWAWHRRRARHHAPPPAR